MWAYRPKEEIPGRGRRSQKHCAMYIYSFSGCVQRRLEHCGGFVEVMVVVEVHSEGSW